jgi:phosphatidylinositol alpha 1,6-mannosyltransferase
MRIALFTETFLPKVDGVVNTLCHLLDHLAQRGHRSLLFAPRGGPSYYAETKVIGLPRISMPGYPELRLVPPWVRVLPELRDFTPHIVRLVNPFTLGLTGQLAARRLGVPTVASYHTDIPGCLQRWHLGMFSPAVNAYLRMLHNRADLNLSPSRATMRMLEEKGFKDVRVWRRGVDTARFHPDKKTDAWRLRLSHGEPQKTLLLYVGRVSFEKRIDWLRPVLAALPGTRLAVVGDGPARKNLERRFSGTPTIFTGYLHGEELSRAYAAADIFVFASQYETVGNVILEAMASGLPVVAPRSGGLLDHVTHGENGLLFDPNDREDLVEAVRHLVSHPSRMRAMGSEGRKYVELHDWSSTLDALLEDYLLTLKGYTRATAGPKWHPAFLDRT